MTAQPQRRDREPRRRQLHPRRWLLAFALGFAIAAPAAARDSGRSFSIVSVIVPTNAPATPPNHIRDVNFQVPASDSTLLYRVCTPPHFNIPAGAQCPNGTSYPLLAPYPSTQQLTWGQWRMINGTVSAKCINSGTHFTVHVSDALPKAQYTIWMVVIGAGPPSPADNQSGMVAPFTTSASGEGQTSFIRPGDDSSPNFPSCVLHSSLPVHLLFAYHPDGLTYGPVPGDASVHALQAFAEVVAP